MLNNYIRSGLPSPVKHCRGEGVESAAPVMRGGAVRGGGIQVTSCVALNPVRRLYANREKNIYLFDK